MTWDEKFIQLAETVSKWSKDPSSKIGAVAVNPETKQVLSLGYNGFPRGIEDTPERLNDRPTKYSLVVHAETNCIYNATLNGVSLKDAHLYVYGLPVCSECAKAITQVKISRVVVKSNTTPDRWKNSIEKTLEIFKEAKITLLQL